MHIMRNTRQTAALAVCAAAAVTGLLTAAPAQAQSTTPHAAAAASSCDVVYWRSTSSQLCFVGTYLDGGRPYRWPVTRLDLRAFANRVWLHQNEDGTGWSKCLTGGFIYDLSGEFQDPGNIQVSANIAPC